MDCGRHSGTAAWTVVDTVRRVVNARPTPGRHLGATWESTWAPRGNLRGRCCGDTWVSSGRQVVDSFPPGRRIFFRKTLSGNQSMPSFGKSMNRGAVDPSRGEPARSPGDAGGRGARAVAPPVPQRWIALSRSGARGSLPDAFLSRLGGRCGPSSDALHSSRAVQVPSGGGCPSATAATATDRCCCYGPLGAGGVTGKGCTVSAAFILMCNELHSRGSTLVPANIKAEQ